MDSHGPNSELSPVAVLGTERRAALVARFLARRSAGDVRPLVIPYSAIGSFVIPILYFAIPHATPGRHWLFHARWLVLASIVLFNLDMMRSTSGANFVSAYAAGLLGSWGIIWGMAVLVFTRPQFEYEIISKRKAKAKVKDQHELKMDRLDEDVRKTLTDGYEYYWQRYPSDGPFLERLRWSINLSMSFRGAGWSFAIPTIPRPAKIPGEEVVRMDTIPIKSYTGMTRCMSRREFFLNRLKTMIVSYLALDFLAVFMMKDPYFILGDPDTSHSAFPPHLLSVPYSLLCLYRYVLTIAGAWSALGLMLSLNEVIQLLAAPWLFGPVQGEVWQYPSIYGSVSNISRRGLLGFWGGYWHQTFRHAFTAPSKWLFGPNPRHPHIARMVALLIALSLSGLLHTAGSYTTVPDSNPWQPPIFFLLSATGMVAQTAMADMLRPVSRKLPVFVRQTANAMFAVGWTYWAAKPLADDFSMCGLWLYEPVPFSPLRALGFGHPGELGWRFERGQMAYLWRGERWWQSGIAL